MTRRLGPIFAILILATLAVMVTFPRAVERVQKILSSQRNRITELRALPVGVIVHVTGVATYIDPNSKQVWIQDETGAINVAVNLSGRGINVGDSVDLTGTKTN